MDININKDYYLILQCNSNDSLEHIKKQYRKLSFEYHPDINKGFNDEFIEISEAYHVLLNNREVYDENSIYGNGQKKELNLATFEFNFNFDFNNKYYKVSNLDIILNIESINFNGTIEYERYLKCKKCQGRGFMKIDCECEEEETCICIHPKCISCNDGGILGIQKINKIKIDKNTQIIKSMGNSSKLIFGMPGNLIINFI